ncbi:MAG: hypothetical protein NEHIOOID_00536 [Holosporales bacterium]
MNISPDPGDKEEMHSCPPPFIPNVNENGGQ